MKRSDGDAVAVDFVVCGEVDGDRDAVASRPPEPPRVVFVANMLDLLSQLCWDPDEGNS